MKYLTRSIAPILTLGILLSLTNVVSLQAEDAASPATKLDDSVVAPFLKQYCIRCHGAEEQNGSARLDRLDYAISDKVEALHYQDVLDVLNGGDMPPEDEPQPSSAELEVVI